MWLAISILVLVLFNIGNAYLDAKRIGSGKTVKHWLNGLLYAILAGAGMYFIGGQWWYLSVFALQAFFSRQVTFDIPLNIWRGLKWDYVSLEEKPHSFLDRIEISIFGRNGEYISLAYIMLWVSTLVVLAF